LRDASAKTIVCWGELLWDMFPDQQRLGGASANVAYHVAQLGEKAVLVSRIGNDALGSEARLKLAGSGVNVDFVQVDSEAPTGTVKIEMAGGEPRYEIAAGAAWDRIEWRTELAPLVSQASALCFGTLAQRQPLGFDVLEQALGHAASSALRICDLNIRAPFGTRVVIDRALGLCNVAKLNEAELEALGKIFGTTDALSWLLEKRNLELVAVTMGARGCLLATREARHHEPGAPVSPDGDPVGAGDAFVAVLASELSRRRSLPLAELAARANRYAAHVAGQRGAMPPPPSWIETRG
jgi:fructokinase